MLVRMNVRTNLFLPRELVAEVDRVAGPRGRSRFVAEVLEQAVRRERQREAMLAGVGMLADRPGYEHWSTSDRVVEWVYEQRAGGRDPWQE
jgi:metal-responsive CopG/Arc/MetJ family transcriptional regulator